MARGKGFTAVLVALNLVFFAAFVREASPAQGLVRVADGVYSYADVKGGGPQNSMGANAGIVVGDKEVLVVDTLISAKEAKRFIADIRAVTDKPIRYVVNTHYHLDHTFGNCEFAALGAVIISQSMDRENARLDNKETLKNSRAYGLDEAAMEGTRVVLPDLAFTDRLEIDLGTREVELIYPGPSHTDGSILVFVPHAKVLFAGDTLFTGYHPFLAEGDIGSWIKVLTYMLTLDVEKIVPGHGPISSKTDVREMRDYIRVFDKKAKELCKRSKDVDWIASEIMRGLPERAEGDRLVKANIQMKYLKK
jgi:cyclase